MEPTTEPAAPALTPSEEMLLGYLKVGMRDAEIAVRLGLPIGKVKERIERLAVAATGGSREELRDWTPPVERVTAPLIEADEPERPARKRQRFKVLLIAAGGLVAAVALLLMWLDTPTRDGKAASVVQAEPEMITIAVPRPLVSVEPATAADLADKAILIAGTCERCRGPALYRLFPTVSGPKLESLFEAPPDTTVVQLVATSDGAEVVALVNDGRRTLAYRSSDGGVTFSQVGSAVGEFLLDGVGPEVLRLKSPDETFFIFLSLLPRVQGQPAADTPWRVVGSQIQRDAALADVGGSAAGWQFGDRTVSVVPSATVEPGEMLLRVDGSGAGVTRAFAGSVLSVAALSGTTALVSVSTDARGKLVASNEPGAYETPAFLDTETGQVRPIVAPFLGDAEFRRWQPIALVGGPFLQVRTDESCVPIRRSAQKDAYHTECAADGVLLGEGAFVLHIDYTWYQVRTPQGNFGYIESWSVEPLPSMRRPLPSALVDPD